MLAITIITLSVMAFSLLKLFIIDMTIRILPNTYVGLFFITVLTLHALTGFYSASLTDVILGACAGGGILLAIRMLGNFLYKQDTLGLGDVKLMAAAGALHGIDYIFLSLTLGALLGVVHALFYAAIQYARTRKTVDLSQLSIPAGPAFIVGIVGVGVYQFRDLIALSF